MKISSQSIYRGNQEMIVGKVIAKFPVNVVYTMQDTVEKRSGKYEDDRLCLMADQKAKRMIEKDWWVGFKKCALK